MFQRSLIDAARILAAAITLLMTSPALALEINAGQLSRLLNQAAYANYEWWCCRLPMYQPGNKALIDDYWINSTVSAESYPVPGDYMGTRATGPGGGAQSNYVTWDGSCWKGGSATGCGAFVAWYMGTRIQYVPGTWVMEWISNGVVVKTEAFEVVPYGLAKHSGDNQSIPVKTATPQPLVASMLHPDGTPAVGKSVTFNVTSKPGGANPPGGLSASSSYSASTAVSLSASTDSSGQAKVYFDSGGKEGSYGISATSASLAPGVTITFTVQAKSTDPNDSAVKDKNLGLDPVNNSSCARATDAASPNPINIATGNKTALETDYLGAGPFALAMSRVYNSLDTRPGRFGNNWRGFYDRSLVVTSTTVKGKTKTVAEAVRHDGRVLRFTLTSGAWVADPDIVDRLTSLSGGGYRLSCGDDQAETYASSGALTSVAAREGFAQQLYYDASGRLAQVTDAFGRSLVFGYDASNRVTGMTDPAGRTYAYTYSAAGNLASVQYPDLTTRLYHYENAAFPRALTGITDENGVRLTTYTYNASGDAVQTVRAGGAQPITVLYYTDGSRQLLDGNGHYRRYAFSVIQGVARRTSLDNAACANCGNAATTTAYSSSGYVSAITDFRGTQTTFVRDARGLEISRTEAVGTSEARTITTTWHATFRLPLTITRTGQRTSFTYDGAGRMLTRTITDTATSAARTWTYTYNAQGLLATVDGPRTDVNDVTRYSYDAQGNLAAVTNPLGHVTRYTNYDAHGRPLSMTDPNGLVTTFTYDLRGRLLTRNAGGLLTSFTYTAAGQPLRTTAADGSWIERQYDAAQQETGLVDSAGQRIAYTLDGKGQRVREEHFDPVNTSVYQRGWSYDPMGRVLGELDAQGTVQWRYAYDANGNRTASTDPYGASTTRVYDALDRIRSSTDSLGAATAYVHDARDNVIRVTDPRSVVTQYTYDGLDSLTQETSPDAGASAFTYDAAGNLKTRSWANGKSVTFTLDALNRVTLEDYGAGVQVSHGWDGPGALGRRASSIDASGGNTWAYDLWGRVTQSLRTTGGRALTTSYTYDAAGRLASMIYPSGRSIGYGYDGAGRVASMTVDSQNLLSGIAWQPYGATRGWTQGNGRGVGRTYDRDGRLQSQTYDIGSRSYGYDLKGRLTTINEPWGSRTYGYDTADRIASETGWAGSYSYAWDGNGNRQSQTSPLGGTSYAYEAGSNRLQIASGVDARAFTHDTAGNMNAEGGYGYGYDARNRLALATSPTNSTSYGHDALGRRTYKSNANSTRYFAHDEQRRVIGEYDAASALSETVWLGNTPVAVLRAGQTYWIDADQIDTPRAVLDVSNQIVWRWRSEAFGNTQAEEDPSGLGGFEFNHRFPGQVFDKETALHHNDHRDYRAHIGRYVASDPMELRGGLNRFGYVEGNPISQADPFGLETYRCIRPLRGHPGPNLRNGPDVWGNVSYHQYSCVRDPSPRGVGFICGGQAPASSSLGNFFFGPGKPTNPNQDYFHPDACEKSLGDNTCFEGCLVEEWSKPRPNYGWPTVGKDCKDYDNDVNALCRKRCGLR